MNFADTSYIMDISGKFVMPRIAHQRLVCHRSSPRLHSRPHFSSNRIIDVGNSKGAWVSEE